MSNNNTPTPQAVGAAAVPEGATAEQIMALVSEYGQTRWSEGSYGATYRAPLQERRDREEAYKLYAQIEAAVSALSAPPSPASPSAPAEVLQALARMEQPLHESRLSGVTAQEDARCMKLIGDFIRSVGAPDAANAGEPAAPFEFCWLVELFEPEGNSMGYYHTGFTDLSGQSRTTKNPHEARRYTKSHAEAVAAKLHHLAGVWRAVEHGFATPTGVAADGSTRAPDDLGARYTVEFDGFTGTVIGSYKRLDGEEGVVMQQDGCKVVHVYRRKWLKPAAPPSGERPSAPAAEGSQQ